MNKKKLACTMVAACMALSATAGAVSVPGTVAVLSNTAVLATAAHQTIRRAATPSTDVVLNAGQTSQIINWPVYNGYGYWKIAVQNQSKSTTKVIIQKGSPTGPQVGNTLVIPAGQTLSFYCDPDSPLATGAYYLSVTTDGTNNLKGHLYYKFGSTYDDLL